MREISSVCLGCTAPEHRIFTKWKRELLFVCIQVIVETVIACDYPETSYKEKRPRKVRFSGHIEIIWEGRGRKHFVLSK